MKDLDKLLNIGNSRLLMQSENYKPFKQKGNPDDSKGHLKIIRDKVDTPLHIRNNRFSLLMNRYLTAKYAMPDKIWDQLLPNFRIMFGIFFQYLKVLIFNHWRPIRFSKKAEFRLKRCWCFLHRVMESAPSYARFLV